MSEHPVQTGPNVQYDNCESPFEVTPGHTSEARLDPTGLEVITDHISDSFCSMAFFVYTDSPLHASAKFSTTI